MSIFQRILGKGRGEPVIVVSGLPRSGTSMAMKMLEAAGIAPFQDGIRSADEDNPKGYFEFEKVKELDKSADKSWVQKARGKALKVISYLLKDLPPDNDYRIVFMHRHLEEVLASQAKMLARRGEKSDVSDERMTEIYQVHLRDVKRLMETRKDFTGLDVHYSDVVKDSAGQAKRIAEFLGLSADAAAKMAAQVDKELYRNRAT
ncbi:MAG: sulfotransferase [bacterium]